MDQSPSNPSRRRVLRSLGASGIIMALGVPCVRADDTTTRRAQNERRPDGRPRLPPDQYPIRYLRPMGGLEGDASFSKFRVKVHGEVGAPFELDFAALLRMPQVDQTCDVHCVTKWTLLDAHFRGVRVADLIARAAPKPSARFVIFEAAHGYTSNLTLTDATKPNVLIAHQTEGRPLPIAHGAPARAIVPDLYFWKSAKWITGIRLSTRDEPGYWEVRGYHNHADPWKEERNG